MDFHGARNKILYAWHNIPFPAVVLQLAGRTAKAIVFSLQPGRMLTRGRGLLNGYYVCVMGQAERRPVNPVIYRLSQELKLRRAIPLQEIENQLPRQHAQETQNWEKPRIASEINR